jgi:hypothetical protein
MAKHARKFDARGRARDGGRLDRIVERRLGKGGEKLLVQKKSGRK